ncbi:short-chain dehydrogenase/reductase SDR [Burkholderia plantarii]|uniref:Short-chain dehydrogenase/reductase SDR n=2 Tax=Burkholderia plantarii TaxID=41899 RepID=A0A0B6RZ49_BURPL|nr:short-chain dehydrogenase/reductase SDR [Burkholderia plantarii]
MVDLQLRNVALPHNRAVNDAAAGMLHTAVRDGVLVAGECVIPQGTGRIRVGADVKPLRRGKPASPGERMAALPPLPSREPAEEITGSANTRRRAGRQARTRRLGPGQRHASRCDGPVGSGPLGAPRRPAGVVIFSAEFLQAVDHQRLPGDQSLEASIAGFEFLESTDFGHVHAAGFASPAMERLLRVVVLLVPRDADDLPVEVDRVRRLDIAVNRAGCEGDPAPIAGQSVAQYPPVSDANVRGTWLALKHEIRTMAARSSGSIAGVSFRTGIRDAPRNALHVASKHARSRAARDPPRSGWRRRGFAPRRRLRVPYRRTCSTG